MHSKQNVGISDKHWNETDVELGGFKHNSINRYGMHKKWEWTTNRMNYGKRQNKTYIGHAQNALIAMMELAKPTFLYDIWCEANEKS